MPKTYSTYEAKSKFSEVLRRVRGGERVTVTYRGRAVAEIRPLEAEPSEEERLRRLEEQGIFQPAISPRRKIEPLAEVPGALGRFLESRD